MNTGDWLTLAALLAAQAGAIVPFLLRIEGRLVRLETMADHGSERRGNAGARARS